MNTLRHDPFFSRESMASLAEQYGVEDVMCWGRTGPQAMEIILGFLGAPIPESLWDFGENVGNMYICGFGVEVTGPDTGDMFASNCGINTLRARRVYPDLSTNDILILETEGHIYCCLADSGRIARYPNIEFPGTDIIEWPSLRTWIEWLFQYAQEARLMGNEV